MTTAADQKVADISLAEWGRKEIAIAETEMPGLMALPLIGAAAASGTVDAVGLYMFVFVFFWTPPHFWALSLLLKDDYEAARVPMLPVVAGVQETKKAILLYTFLLLALTSMFFTTGAVGWTYLAVSTGLGLLLVLLATTTVMSVQDRIREHAVLKTLGVY